MKNEWLLYIDQYGNKICASSRKELVETASQKLGVGRHVSIMYQDKKDGRTVRTGYVVGTSWFSAYRPVELPVIR